MKTEVKLKIADIIIEMQSDFTLEQLTKEEQRLQIAERFKNFFYNGKREPNILIDVEIIDKLPQIRKTEPVFITYHFQDGSENWRLLKKDDTYIYKSPLKDKRQLMLVNETFDRVTAYLLPKKDKGRVWNTSDIIYDFLQVLLINYFALKKGGIFTHAIGVKDLDGRGLLFAGKSGSGKTATARLWHKHSKAMVLNDDRIIVRKVNGKFLIYGSPWHGEFSDYLTSRIDSAPLEKLLFIHHSLKNTVRQISEKTAFNFLYPALFPTFWDKECLENIVSFCQDLIRSVPCYSLGFVNDNRVIRFVRKIE
ncbi:MAG: hypothetical protein ACE5IT_08660 [bacterium]